MSPMSRTPTDVMDQVRARSGRAMISHAAAREIARTFVSNYAGIARTFIESGKIARDPAQFWRAMFGFGTYATLTSADQDAADALDLYLSDRPGGNGAVPGWSTLTLSD